MILSNKLNIASINICSEAEGPFKRMAIWFQGCNILCKGCCNPELQELKVAHILTIQEVLNIAIDSKAKNKIEGVTFLGGEPTLQSGLSILANGLSELGLGTILFTGKKYEQLDIKVKNSVDLIIDGKFEKDLIETDRNLVGSVNQNIIYVTDRYKGMEDWFLIPREKRVEININDSIFINGDVIEPIY